MSETLIKICGLSRQADIDAVNETLPDFAGFVFYPKSKRFITESQAKALSHSLNKRICPVGVFVDADPARIIRLSRAGAIGIAQLHGHEDTDYIRSLKNAVPELIIWKAVLYREKDDLKNARALGADRLLLDHGYGAGKRFDWSLPMPEDQNFILAGGLTPENIPEAISRFHPWAVDLSSGVETDGVKDKSKIKAAVTAARNTKRI